MGNVQNVKVGQCSVVFKGIDLGHTEGGEEVTYTPAYYDVMVDKYGKTVVDKKLIGEKFTAKVILAETTIANLKVAIPTAQGNSTKATIGRSAGQSMLAAAGLLVLHPVGNASNNLADDIVMWQAVSGSPIAVGYKVDGTRLYEVMFEALIDETRTDGQLLGLIGDSTT